LIGRGASRPSVTEGGTAKVEFDEFEIAAPAPDDQLVAVNDALTTLAAAHPAQAEVVKLRYFVGLTNEDVAALMGISVSTVKNYWNFARAWLFSEIRGE
jgi:RNA polymerase sigma factor (sigma-70 family)